MKNKVARFEEDTATVERYIDGEFYIYIVEDKEAAIPIREFLLQQVGMGYVMHCFGGCINQPDCADYKDKGGVESMEDFLNIVKGNLQEYKRLYLDELNDYEEFCESRV